MKFEDHESKIKSQRKVSCKCDCGNQIISRLNCVMGGQRQSCGCVKNKNRIKNIIKRNEKYKGKKYGKLLILKYVEDKKTKHSNSYYLCKCDCGNEKIIELRSMKSGRVKSCGCIQKERIRKIGKESKLPFGESPFNSLYIRYVKSAENRHLSFLLTKDQFKNIVIKNCYYCNCSPEIYTRNRYYKDTDYFIHNGIDRINSEKGYEMDNCVPCCSFCNYSKSDYEEKYFLDKIVKIYNHKIKNEISNNTKNSFN